MEYSPVVNGKKGLTFTHKDIEEMKSDLAFNIEKIARATRQGSDALPNQVDYVANKPTVNGGLPIVRSKKSCRSGTNGKTISNT